MKTFDFSKPDRVLTKKFVDELDYLGVFAYNKHMYSKGDMRYLITHYKDGFHELDLYYDVKEEDVTIFNKLKPVKRKKYVDELREELIKDKRLKDVEDLEEVVQDLIFIHQKVYEESPERRLLFWKLQRQALGYLGDEISDISKRLQVNNCVYEFFKERYSV